MHPLKSFHLVLFLSITTVLAELLGPTYPPPNDLSSSQSHVRQAWAQVSSTFDDVFKHDKKLPDLIGAEMVTFSASLFSLHDSDAADLQYHYTAPQIANARHGTNKVDGDSVYRVASISKLITVYVGQLRLTDEQWNMPLSTTFPQLASGSRNASVIYTTQWDQITPLALACQISGISSIGLPQDDLIIIQYLPEALQLNKSWTALAAKDGFPPVSDSAFGPFLYDPSRAAFLKTIATDKPVELPWTTPGYSDLGLMLLGAAISELTGEPFDKMYHDAVFGPLNMTSSFANAPLSGPVFKDHAVVAGPLNGSWSQPKNYPLVPSGGILSTINDLNKLGIGILNSTLLNPVQTRQWMKPHSHTASLTESFGAPWEIVRYVHHGTEKVTDIYCKLGDSGAYGGIVALLPDYDAGFTFLNAYYEVPATLFRGSIALALINRIAEAIIPALEAQAKEEADRNFVGHYVATESNLNSSLTISMNDAHRSTLLSGLSISRWISNGTDMLKVNGKARLQPTIIDRANAQIAFRGSNERQWSTYEKAGLGPFTGFYDSNWDVWTYDGSHYGGYNTETFVFDLDGSGRAERVRIPALRLTLVRETGNAVT